MPAPPQLLTGFGALAPGYDALLCDVWGVLHDGVTAHPAASEALRRFRAGGGVVVLVSNAPRPAATVLPFLDAVGVPRDGWDDMVTSGDVTRELIARSGAPNLHWLGPPRDAPLFEGLDVPHVGLDEAAMIVCTGLLDDETETPDSYADLLARARARDLDLVCANPDLVVERGRRLVYCAGAIAERYEALGGRVVYAGKPHAPIYGAALARAAAALGRAPRRPLAVGDALRTDIAGALAQGIDALLVLRGIHTEELGLGDGAPDPARVAAFLAASPARPTAIIERLVW